MMTGLLVSYVYVVNSLLSSFTSLHHSLGQERAHLHMVNSELVSDMSFTLFLSPPISVRKGHMVNGKLVSDMSYTLLLSPPPLSQERANGKRRPGL